MSKVLIVTVGGSPQPIITSVETLKPEHVVFICSAGPQGSHSQVIGKGKPCKIRKGGQVVKELPNLPAHLNLDKFDPDNDLVIIDEPDDPSECYGVATSTIRRLLTDYDNRDIMADYTGGTKTMSLALGMAAMDYDINLFLTTSVRRPDLTGIDTGESTELVSTSLIDIERKIEQFLPVYLKQYQFPAAIAQLQKLLTSSQMPKNSKKHVRILLDCCRAFDAWDKFDHASAWELLQNLMKYSEIKPRALFLKRVMSSRQEIDENFTAPGRMAAHGYEIVEDLLFNAERRAAQDRYDDAVSRLYRALELLVQIRLWDQHGIKTGQVETEKLPDAPDLKGIATRYDPLPSGKTTRVETDDPIPLLNLQSSALICVRKMAGQFSQTGLASLR